jgi:hypothetical protein
MIHVIAVQDDVENRDLVDRDLVDRDLDEESAGLAKDRPETELGREPLRAASAVAQTAGKPVGLESLILWGGVDETMISRNPRRPPCCALARPVPGSQASGGDAATCYPQLRGWCALRRIVRGHRWAALGLRLGWCRTPTVHPRSDVTAVQGRDRHHGQGRCEPGSLLVHVIDNRRHLSCPTGTFVPRPPALRPSSEGRRAHGKSAGCSRAERCRSDRLPGLAPQPRPPHGASRAARAGSRLVIDSVAPGTTTRANPAHTRPNGEQCTMTTGFGRRVDPGTRRPRMVQGRRRCRELTASRPHDAMSQGAWTLSMRVYPRSMATSASRSRSWCRPRCSRDITVPTGVSIIRAISLYGKPSTSA